MSNLKAVCALRYQMTWLTPQICVGVERSIIVASVGINFFIIQGLLQRRFKEGDVDGDLGQELQLWEERSVG